MAGNILNVRGRELPRTVFLKSDANDPDPLREFEVTVPELFRLVKRTTGRTLFIRAGWFAHSIDQNGVESGKARGWEISGNVEVPKRIALRFLESAYSERARTLVYARVTFSNNCFFIGG
jgi:hypothetical protein